MQEMWIRALGQEDPLEKEMATHSSILAWKTHELRTLVGCGPWGRRRVRHNLEIKQEQLQCYNRLTKNCNLNIMHSLHI